MSLSVIETPEQEIQKRGAQAVSLIAAPFTPMTASGMPRFELLGDYADRLVRDGVSGVFVGGTSGEGMSLTQTERMKLATQWKRAVDGRMRLIVHVGHSSLLEAESLARHAAELQVDAIASIGPTFYTANAVQSLVSYCQGIASAAPSLPFYYYHMPSMSRVPLQASALFSELAKTIPTFRGIKFTHEDLPDYERCLKLAGSRYEIFFGRDELLLQGLEKGAHSAVGSTYNFAAPLYLQMAKAWSESDSVEAARLQAFCTQAIEIMVRYQGLVGIKSTMSLVGLECGGPRLPLPTLSAHQTATLRSDLESIRFFELLHEARAALADAEQPEVAGSLVPDQPPV